MIFDITAFATTIAKSINNKSKIVADAAIKYNIHSILNFHPLFELKAFQTNSTPIRIGDRINCLISYVKNKATTTCVMIAFGKTGV